MVLRKFHSLLFRPGGARLVHLFYLSLHIPYREVFFYYEVGYFKLVPVALEPQKRFGVAHCELLCLDGQLYLGRKVEQAQVVGYSRPFFADPESRLQLNERLESEKEVQDFEVLVRTYEGDSPFWLLTSATTIDYNYDVVLYAAFQDITSRKNREVLLKNQATRDPLTSLYNRRYFEDEVNKRIAAARNNNGTYCILMTDVDLFKRVNDTYGHKTGDKVLIELASACERALRDKDIVARYGGEEFVIYLDNVDIEDARIVAERLRQTISSLKVPSDDGRIVTFSISIGISSSQVSDNIDTLIKTADEALYKAKQNGRNRVELFLPDDLKNFNPDANNMHKSEAATRHPIFEKEGAEEISLLDGVAEKHIEGSPSEINHQPPRPQNNPPVSAPQNPQNPQNHNNNGQQ